MRRHVRTSCKIAPNTKNGDEGMKKLYDHTIRRQQAQLEAQQAQLELLQKQIAQLVAGQAVTPAGPTIQTQGDGNRIQQIVVNVHGQEGIGHLTEAKVRALLDDAIKAVPQGLLPQAASQAVVKAAMLVYSDPEHPENLTAYLPNKKLNDVLVHTADGWEVQPTTLVLPPMAQKSVDALFTNQPYEDADDYAPLLRELAENEARYTAGTDLRPILVRNKNLLVKALGTLPVASTAGMGSS